MFWLINSDIIVYLLQGGCVCQVGIPWSTVEHLDTAISLAVLFLVW